MVGQDGTNVSLRLANGNVVPVAIASLSAADQEFLKSQPKGAVPGADVVALENRRWPDVVEVRDFELDEIKAVREGDGLFIYQTESFEFSSPERLSAVAIKSIARSLEATKRLVAASPWGIDCRPEPGRERHSVAFYRTQDDYRMAGGRANTVKAYDSRAKILRITLDAGRLRKAGDEYDGEFDTGDGTIHEIMHQMLATRVSSMPGWAMEGCADLIQLMPYKSGRFRVEDHRKAIKSYVVFNQSMMQRWKGTGRKDEKELAKDVVTLTNLKDHFEIPSDYHWGHGGSNVGNQLRFHSGLLAYYFNFLDGQPGWRWGRFMGGNRGEPSASASRKQLELLLDGRSEEQLQNEMIEKFAKAGIKIEFGPLPEGYK